LIKKNIKPSANLDNPGHVGHDSWIRFYIKNRAWLFMGITDPTKIKFGKIPMIQIDDQAFKDLLLTINNKF